MKVSSNYKNIIEKLNFYSLLLFVFWLPLKDDYLPAIMALWISTWLLQGNLKTRFTDFPYKYFFMGFCFYILLMLINVFRITNYDEAFFQIQKKLSFIFFPIILVGSVDKIWQKTNTILIVFILGNLIAALYCLTNAFVLSFVIENGQWYFKHQVWQRMEHLSFRELIDLRASLFSYGYLSIFKHPSYFSMYIIFSLLIIVDFFRKNLIKKKYQKISAVILSLFFLGMFYLLQSRAAFITLGIVLSIIILIELRKKFRKRFVLFGIFLIIIPVIILFTNNRISRNIKESITLVKNTNLETIKKSDVRFKVWYTSIQIIKENFWLGTSPAELTSKLVKKYQELGFQKAADEELNAHNQYLESFAGLGIFGFLALLFIIIYTFIISIKQKHYLLFFLMVILSINFLFESMLNRMAGVLFMMFFISLFVFAKKPEKDDSKIETLKE